MPKFSWDQFDDAAPAQAGGQSPGNTPAAPPHAKFSWDDYQDLTPQKSPSDPMQASQAALEHFGNAAAMGYLPQLQAGLGGTLNPNAALDAKLRNQGFTVPQNTYVQDRDTNIQRLNQEAQNYPKSSIAGSVAGSIAAGIGMNALAPINAVSRAGRIAQAARGGAILGAINNPGDQEGVVNDPTDKNFQLNDRISNALGGALLGGGSQGLVEGIAGAAKGIANLPENLQNAAEERAFKATGAMKRDFKNAGKTDQINAIGRYMLDQGLIRPGMTVEDIADAAKNLESQHRTAITGILAKLDQAGAQAPSANALAQEVEKQALPLKNLNTAQPTYQTLQNVAGDMRTLGKDPAIGVSAGTVSPLTGRGTEYLTDPKTGQVMAQFQDGNMVTASGSSPVSAESASAATVATPNNLSTKEIPGTFRSTQDIKNFVNDQIEASGGWKAPNPSEKNLALRQVYHTVSQAMEQSADQAAQGLGDKSISANYLAQKSGLRNAGAIAKIAADKAAAIKANNPFSMSDYLSGGFGAVAGAMTGDSVSEKLKHAAIGASLGLGNKALRTYGTPYLSRAMDSVGGTLAKAYAPASYLGDVAAPITKPIMSAIRQIPISSATAEGVLSRPSLETGAVRNVASQTPPQPQGYDRFAAQGAQKLGLKDTDTQSLMQSPEMKKLLIQASDLKPGTPAMNRIMDQIRKGLRKN